MNRQLIILLGSLQVQNDNLQLAHWNLKTPDFITLHEYLGENYECTSKHIDAVAELIRMNDSSFIIPEKNLQVKASKVAPLQSNKSIERGDVIAASIMDVEKILELAFRIFKATASIADVNDYMALIYAEYKKRRWFLKQSS